MFPDHYLVICFSRFPTRTFVIFWTRWPSCYDLRPKSSRRSRAIWIYLHVKTLGSRSLYTTFSARMVAWWSGTSGHALARGCEHEQPMKSLSGSLWTKHALSTGITRPEVAFHLFRTDPPIAAHMVAAKCAAGTEQNRPNLDTPMGAHP